MSTTLLSRPTVAEIEAATRRDVLRGTGLLTLTGLIAACAGNPTDPAVDGGTRTVEHPAGTTEVPVRPSRIVALADQQLTWPLVRLGVLPVGTQTTEGTGLEFLRRSDPGAADALDRAGFTSVGVSEPDLEAIAALRPDLILCPDWQQDFYPQLSAIGPTVVVQVFDEERTDPHALDRTLAEVVGVTDALDGAIAAYERRIAALRAVDPQMWSALEYVGINDWDETTNYLTFDTAPAAGFWVLDALGARPSPSTLQLLASGDGEISDELVPGLDGDVVFVNPPYATADAPITDRLLTLLAGSTAAGRDQVFRVGNPWEGVHLGALNRVVDDLEAILATRGGRFVVS